MAYLVLSGTTDLSNVWQTIPQTLINSQVHMFNLIIYKLSMLELTILAKMHVTQPWAQITNWN